MKNWLKKYQKNTPVAWATTLFMLITPLVGIFGTIWWVATDRFHWGTLALFFITWAITAMGITGGFHRLFSHRTYEASRPLQIWFIFAGGAAWEGSCLEWCRDHRRHHRYVDTERDPYNINEGFWWAHILWLVFDRREPTVEKEIADLTADPLIRWQYRHYAPITILTSFGLPILLATFWGDFWGGLFVASALRISVNHHCTFFINSLCHVAGTQTYSDSHTARDNWVAALLTYGEGYHNYHHEFPSDYRNGIRSYHWDPTKWMIWTCNKLGLASGLKQVAPEKSLSKRLAMQEKHLLERLGNITTPGETALNDIRERFQSVATRMAELRTQYNDLTHTLKSGWDAATAKKLMELKQLLREAERELRKILSTWQAAARGIGHPLPA